MAVKRPSSRFAARACQFMRLPFLCRSRTSGRRPAFNFVRFAFLCRSSSVCRQRPTPKQTLWPNFFKILHLSNSTFDGVRGFFCSTDETPVSRRNFHGATRNWPFLPLVPCIDAAACVKDDSFSIYDHGSNHDSDLDDDIVAGESQRSRWVGHTGRYGCSWKEEDVDRKAGEFIAQVRKQMELERRTSYLRYMEMLDRGAR